MSITIVVLFCVTVSLANGLTWVRENPVLTAAPLNPTPCVSMGMILYAGIESTSYVGGSNYDPNNFGALTMIYSRDSGKTWQRADMSTRADGLRAYCACSQNNVVAVASNSNGQSSIVTYGGGDNWIVKNQPYQLGPVAFANNIFGISIFTGFNKPGKVLVSTDGSAWNVLPANMEMPDFIKGIGNSFVGWKYYDENVYGSTDFANWNVLFNLTACLQNHPGTKGGRVGLIESISVINNRYIITAAYNMFKSFTLVAALQLSNPNQINEIFLISKTSGNFVDINYDSVNNMYYGTLLNSFNDPSKNYYSAAFSTINASNWRVYPAIQLAPFKASDMSWVGVGATRGDIRVAVDNPLLPNSWQSVPNGVTDIVAYFGYDQNTDELILATVNTQICTIPPKLLGQPNGFTSFPLFDAPSVILFQYFANRGLYAAIVQDDNDVLFLIGDSVTTMKPVSNIDSYIQYGTKVKSMYFVQGTVAVITTQTAGFGTRVVVLTATENGNYNDWGQAELPGQYSDSIGSGMVGGKLTIITTGNNVLQSSDGDTFSLLSANLPVPSQGQSCIFSVPEISSDSQMLNGFLSCTNPLQSYVSTDGIIWDPIVVQDQMISTSFVFGNYYAGLYSGVILSSPNGMTWNNQNGLLLPVGKIIGLPDGRLVSFSKAGSQLAVAKASEF